MAKRTTLQGKFSVAAFTALQERIIRRLRAAGKEGIKQYDLYSSLGSPITKRSLLIALNALTQQGFVESHREYTGYRGRPPLVWYATRKASV